MEEIKASSLFVPLDIFFCKIVVFFHDLRKILLTNGVIFLRLSHYRLNRHAFETKIGKFQNILREIQIITGKGSSDIIVLIAS